MTTSKGIREEAWQKIEEINQIYDAKAQRRFIETIMREDKVDRDEAFRLTREDPQYSLGWKMCSPSVMLMIRSRKGQERFRGWLTPEEDEIFTRDVIPMNLGKLVKDEMKRKKVKG